MHYFKGVLILLFCSFTAIIYAQVPNGGFEQWTNGEPDGWFTNNFVTPTITQTSDVHSGSSAVKGTIVDYNSAILEPLLMSGALGGKGFPISQRYTNVTGYYKFSPVGSELFDVIVGMWKNGQVVGVGGKEFNAASAYTAFSVPVTYVSSNVPDSCQISVTIASSDTAHPGSVFYLDDLAMNTNPTAVNDNLHQLTYKLMQNYPNPFNPTTVINFEIPVSGNVTLTIYNSLGQQVKTLLDEHRNAGDYQVNWNGKDMRNISAPSGIYFYRIQSGHFVQSKKMILLK